MEENTFLQWSYGTMQSILLAQEISNTFEQDSRRYDSPLKEEETAV